MFIQKQNRIKVYSYLFKEGTLVAKKDYYMEKHSDEIPIPNIEVLALMKSFASKKFVKETFNWQYYYYYLTNEGIEYLRQYLALPEEIIPATLKVSNKPTAPPGRPSNDRGDKKSFPPGEGFRPSYGGRGEGREGGGDRGGRGGGDRGGRGGGDRGKDGYRQRD
jgi:small subunit ribosomal protein S10e